MGGLRQVVGQGVFGSTEEVSVRGRIDLDEPRKNNERDIVVLVTGHFDLSRELATLQLSKFLLIRSMADDWIVLTCCGFKAELSV